MKGLSHRDQTLYNPTLSLSSYCMSISSSSLHWINILSLNTINCSRQDLIGICNLANLGLLKIGPNMNILDNYRAGVDESILRNVGHFQHQIRPQSSSLFIKQPCTFSDSVSLVRIYAIIPSIYHRMCPLIHTCISGLVPLSRTTNSDICESSFSMANRLYLT